MSRPNRGRSLSSRPPPPPLLWRLLSLLPCLWMPRFLRRVADFRAVPAPAPNAAGCGSRGASPPPPVSVLRPCSRVILSLLRDLDLDLDLDRERERECDRGTRLRLEAPRATPPSPSPSAVVPPPSPPPAMCARSTVPLVRELHKRCRERGGSDLLAALVVALVSILALRALVLLIPVCTPAPLLVANPTSRRWARVAEAAARTALLLLLLDKSRARKTEAGQEMREKPRREGLAVLGQAGVVLSTPTPQVYHPVYCCSTAKAAVTGAYLVLDKQDNTHGRMFQKGSSA